MITLPIRKAGAPMVALACLALAACASPEQQLRVGLTNAGLPDGIAACMAQDMTPKLSLDQLLKLRSLSRVGRLDPAKTSLDKYLRQVRALGDAEIWRVTSVAAARCSLGI
jgi:hypothetical protein